jgi:hypothetical protein
MTNISKFYGQNGGFLLRPMLSELREEKYRIFFTVSEKTPVKSIEI